MWRLIATRLAAFVPTVLATSLVLFVTVNVVPGSAAKAALGIDATAQAIARFEHEQGLDRPLHVQYLDWLGKAVRGDFGTSFQNHLPVGPELVSRLPVTLELAILAFLIANAIAVPLGALAAYHHQQRLDSVISVFATVLGAVPSFWLATVLILILALTVKVLPAGGYVPFAENPAKNVSLFIMPALSLGLVSSALLLRVMRAKMIEVLSSDYIHTALAKGAAPNVVIWRHALQNALITFLTVGAVEFGCLVGLVVLSAIFADVISPYSPYDIDVAIKLQPPNRAHWLGTDEFGRDVLSRVIHAARISVKVAAVAESVGLIGGGVIGIAAGYFGGPVDMVLMSSMELLFSFPAILLAIVLVSGRGTGVLNGLTALGT